MTPQTSTEPAVPAARPGEDEAARPMLSRQPPSLHLALAAIRDPGSISTADVTAFVAEMREETGKLRRNDFSGVEDMLMHQALALQTLFTQLTARGLVYSSAAPLGRPTGHAELLLRYGLKAQAQCAATLQTLGGLKKAPAVFAQQANITTGPQQINNHATISLAPQTAANSAGSTPGGLHDEPIPPRETAALARPTDSPIEAVGEIGRTADDAGQGDLIAQRLERRRPSRTARARKGAA